MYICFAEYRIGTEQRKQFLAYTEALLALNTSVYLYEGTGQPGLFVEVWNASTEEEAERIKKERCSERSPWFIINEWIDGGADKMHIWTFRPAHSDKAGAVNGQC